MQKDVVDAPPFLKRLTDPLTVLLGVPITARESATTPTWPDPGHEAHVILHREFSEAGSCPHLDNPDDEALFPLDGQPPTQECPLGLTSRRFAIAFGEGRRGALILGPYFTRQADRTALAGRSKAADSALALLPYCSRQRQAFLTEFCAELAAFAGSAAQAGSVKETFLANMSHELRTPLNGVMGMLSLVLQGELPPRQRQFLTLAMDAANQLLSLVNDLLEMTTISSGRLVLAEEPFGLRREIEPLLSACAEDAARRGLAFTADIDANVPENLLGDSPRLKQILLNLIQNALKFTEQGSVTVRVSCLAETADEKASTLLFSVRDTGIGIPPDRQRHIFGRFTIGEDFLRKRHGSLGVGLAICKEIVEKMGGTLHVESVPGRGSMFSFTAVLRLNGDQDRSEPVARADPGQGAVVLIAETEPVSRLLVRRILENQGYMPIVADSSQAFLDELRQRPVDMALVDLDNPRLDAVELLRRIRAGREPGIAPNFPIVVLPPHGADPTRYAAIGASGFLTKPVTRQELLATVEQVLSGRPRSSLLKPHAD
jgi:signal transduction histidine kinase/ActR/RegA family two-component response regulator